MPLLVMTVVLVGFVVEEGERLDLRHDEVVQGGRIVIFVLVVVFFLIFGVLVLWLALAGIRAFARSFVSEMCLIFESSMAYDVSWILAYPCRTDLFVPFYYTTGEE